MNPSFHIADMKPFWSHPVFTLTVSSLILLSAPPTSANFNYDGEPATKLASAVVEEATDWILHSQSIEKQNKSDPCNAPPSLSYLRSHLKHLVVYEFDDPTRIRVPWPGRSSAARLLYQPLHYSFYVQNVLQPYRSRLPEANATSTSFCYLDKEFEVCEGKEVWDCKLYRDAAVCFPNTDSSSSRSSKSTVEGTCVSCTDLKTELTKGKLKDETSIGYLMDTCEPKKRRGPNPVPKLQQPNADKNTTKEVRWLRWFLESSYVFEKKKAGDKCNERPNLSRARSYLCIFL
jgi:hypothetical protein